MKSSGVAIVVLKRLSAAVADHDTIHAVIAGSAMNNDGAKVGFTAPSEEGLAEAIERAYEVAGVDPDTVAFVEAHGTATRLGDPTEVRALTRAYRRWTDRRGFCALGSAKANLGHLDAAAGAVGLIKAALALSHEVTPPLAGFLTPNPLLDLPETPFYVNSAPAPWPRGSSPRRAGVSAMGVGGANVHVVLEEAPKMSAPSPTRPFQLLCLSARTPTALAGIAERLDKSLTEEPALNLADMAYTLATGRTESRHRAAVVARDGEEARRALAQQTTQAPLSSAAGARSAVFMFPGHGVHYPRMGRDLYEVEPVYRTEVDRCLAFLREEVGLDMRPLLLGDAPEDDPRLDQMRWAQPLLFTVEYALGRQFMAWGVRPAAMLGHSFGEYVAACLAGVFSLPDALSLVASRGRIMDETPPGGMLMVFQEEQAVAPYLGAGVAIATYAPSCVVLSGPGAAIEALRARFENEGIETRSVRVSRASHTPLMGAVRDEFRRRVAELVMESPAMPIVSNLTGALLTAEQAQSPDYWADHLCRPVQLNKGLETLLELGSPVFIELGPGTSIGSSLKAHQSLAGDWSGVVATMPGYKRREESAHMAVLRGLGKAWELGVGVDWVSFYAHEKRRKIPLPPHPFEGGKVALAAEPAPVALDPNDRASEHARALGVRGVDDYPGLRARLEELCAALALDFFTRRLGDGARDAYSVEGLRRRAGILPKLAPMVEYMTRLLVRAGLASESAGGRLALSVDRSGRAAELAARLREDYPTFVGLVRFIERCVGHYDGALTGTIETVEVLYPDGTDAFYRACMRDTQPYLYDGGYLATARDAVAEFVARRRGQKTRILEVGAGHGTLTWPLAMRLRGADVEYHFTDIGRSFLLRAEAEAEQRGLSFMRCFRFDLNQSPASQGLDGSYDLILGFNAVHVALDLTPTLRNLRDMLAPGGSMFLVELTRAEPWDYLTWGLAPGFWDIERARGGSLGMDLERWEESLQSAGFTRIRAIPRENSRRAAEEHGLLIAERGRVAVRAEAPRLITKEPAQRVGAAPNGHAPRETAHTTPDEAERTVRGLWERMLGASHIPAGANFFDLGGDSLLTVQFLANLRVRTGHEIKTSQFASDPTVEGLAARLRAAQATAAVVEPHPSTGASEAPACPEPVAAAAPAPQAVHAAPAAASVPENAIGCLVPLRPTGTKRPFFCVHPIGGGALCYARLAREMAPDRPFYGLQSPMIEDRSARPGSIEEMATLYVEAIRRVQPEGPYFLGGWSFGGGVAAEMARRLQALEEKVAELVLLDVDASPPMRLNLLRRLDERLPVLAMLPTIFTEIRGVGATDGRGRPGGVERLAETLGVAARHLSVYDRHLALWRAHRPSEQTVPATHFVARDKPRRKTLLRRFKARALSIRGLTTVAVPGDHFSMLSDGNVSGLAARIDDALDNAERRLRASEGEGHAPRVEGAEESIYDYLRRFIELTRQDGRAVVQELWAQSDACLLFDSYEGMFAGVKSVGDQYEDEFKAIKDIEIRTYDERAYAFAGGQAAFATSLLDADMKLVRSGKRVFFRRVRVSWALEKVGGAWRAAHVHYSLPVGEPLSKME